MTVYGSILAAGDQSPRKTPTAIGLLLLLALLAWPWPTLANPGKTDHVTARLVADRTPIAPGETVDLALIFEIQPGWHTYWRNPGDSGDPPRLAWTLPAGVTEGVRPQAARIDPLAAICFIPPHVHPGVAIVRSCLMPGAAGSCPD